MPLARQARVVALGALMFAAAASAKRPYTVDDMLELEEIGKVRFDAQGGHLIFERYGPFEQQSDFSRPFVRGEYRSKLYIVDLARRSVPTLLFEQNPADGYALNGLSPDGSLVAFDHVTRAGVREGVSSRAGGAVREFDFPPDYNDAVDASWIANRQLAFTALAKGETSFPVGIQAERLEELSRLWSDAHAGRVSTERSIGSGRYSRLPETTSNLVLADAGDGSSRMLAPGKFSQIVPSPSGTHIAALRDDRLKVDPARPLEHGANMGGVMRSLVVQDVTAPYRSIEACKGCDVLTWSLSWSPDGRKLAFVARAADQTWEAPDFWVYDVRERRSRKQDLAGRRPHLARVMGLTLLARSAWVGHRLALLLDRPDGTSATLRRDVRADWFVMQGGRLRNLTGSFAKGTPELFAVTTEGLLLLDEGKVWLVSPGGARRELAAGAIAEPVRVWRQPTRYGEQPYFNLQPVRVVTLQSIPDAQEKRPSRFYFVDVRSGHVEQVAAPSPEARALAASAAARKVAFEADSSGATSLVVSDANGASQVIVEVNRHLRDIASATPVRIDHEGPEGDVRHSWLLVPPGHEKGGRLPTVVNVYPGSACPETFTRWQVNVVHALNDQILAGRGYAVLYPCVPVQYEKTPRDPMDGLVEQVFSGVDAAVAKGLVDPDRLAVQGQSYGGYTTGALVGLTHRFKAAVAQAGLYDLISSYGVFDERERLDVSRTGLSLFAASLAETSQTGMGAPPWEDPQRYLRNSPLMHVKAVTTPILLINGDRDYVSTTQSEELFTALTRLGKDAKFVRFFGEDHVFNSPANIRAMWRYILDWYGEHLGPPVAVESAPQP